MDPKYSERTWNRSGVTFVDICTYVYEGKENTLAEHHVAVVIPAIFQITFLLFLLSRLNLDKSLLKLKLKLMMKLCGHHLQESLFHFYLPATTAAAKTTLTLLDSNYLLPSNHTNTSS
jgi:hypothetical protein